MERVLLKFLAVTGICAAVVVAEPVFVAIGLFPFVLPGLILAFVPLAFLWTAVFALVYLPLRRLVGSEIASIVAVPATVAAFWFAAEPGHEQGLANLAKATLPEVRPTTQIALAGDVRIDEQFPRLDQVPRGSRSPQLVLCDGLCAVTLTTPGVRSVTVTYWERGEKPDGYRFGGEPLSGSARTFRIVPAVDCEGLSDQLAMADLREDQAEGVRLRLPVGACVASEAPLVRHDMQITVGEYWRFGKRASGMDWSLGAKGVRIEELEVRGLHDGTLVRRMITDSPILDRPLYPRIDGGIDSARFGWSRSRTSGYGPLPRIDAEDLLGTYTNLDFRPDHVVTASWVAMRRERRARRSPEAAGGPRPGS